VRSGPAMMSTTVTIHKLNQLNRELWERRYVRVKRLMAKKHLLHLVSKRESDKAQFVKLATSEAERRQRISDLKSFESELESANEEFSSLPIFSAQRTRARNPRGVVANGTTIDQIIARLALKPDHRDETAKELWPHFFAELNEYELDPKEYGHPTDFKKSQYEYDFKGNGKRITYGRCALGLPTDLNEKRYSRLQKCW